jgi:hypothetical protein
MEWLINGRLTSLPMSGSGERRKRFHRTISTAASVTEQTKNAAMANGDGPNLSGPMAAPGHSLHTRPTKWTDKGFPVSRDGTTVFASLSSTDVFAPISTSGQIYDTAETVISV